MAKTPENHRKRWTVANDRELRKLVKQNTRTGLLAWKLGRTEDAIYGHASEIGLSLQPPNRSPRNPRKR